MKNRVSRETLRDHGRHMRTHQSVVKCNLHILINLDLEIRVQVLQGSDQVFDSRERRGIFPQPFTSRGSFMHRSYPLRVSDVVHFPPGVPGRAEIQQVKETLDNSSFFQKWKSRSKVEIVRVENPSFITVSYRCTRLVPFCLSSVRNVRRVMRHC